MNLQVIVALAQIVSALAVLLTLVVLIISIRQNTRSQKALVVDSLAAAITSINVPAMESPVLGSALSKATADWSSASREERIIAHFFSSSFSSYWRMPGTSRKQASLIRHSGLDGRNCFENTTTAMACAVYGGQLVSTGIRQSFKNSFRKQSRRTNSAA